MRNNKRAFTMAEVLLSMAIISVVTILMLKTVVLNKPNQEQILLRKAHIQTSNIVNQMLADTNLYMDSQTSVHANFGNTQRVDYKGNQYGSNEADEEGERARKSKFCELFKTFVNIAKEGASCTPDEDDVSFKDGVESEGHFTTTDGIVWIMPINDFRNENAPYSIWIDVNSASGSSNCDAEGDKINTCNNPDRFRIILRQNGQIEVPTTDKIQRYYLMNTDINKPFGVIKEEAMKIVGPDDEGSTIEDNTKTCTDTSKE